MWRHGTHDGYANYGCRCDPAKAAPKPMGDGAFAEAWDLFVSGKRKSAVAACAAARISTDDFVDTLLAVCRWLLAEAKRPKVRPQSEYDGDYLMDPDARESFWDPR